MLDKYEELSLHMADAAYKQLQEECDKNLGSHGMVTVSVIFLRYFLTAYRLNTDALDTMSGRDTREVFKNVR